MQPLKENPALVARGVPNSDQLAGSITSECTLRVRKLQASLLTRRCAISFAMAAIIAPLFYGDAS
jgi:hypothetical protein